MLDPTDIPADTLAAIRRYVECRDYPGSFLTYVLRGDLINTFRVGKADDLAALPAILGYLHWEVPATCYGSPEKVSDWVAPPEPSSASDIRPLLRNAKAGQLQSYLDAAHDIGAAATEGAD